MSRIDGTHVTSNIHINTGSYVGLRTFLDERDFPFVSLDIGGREEDDAADIGIFMSPATLPFARKLAAIAQEAVEALEGYARARA